MALTDEQIRRLPRASRPEQREDPARSEGFLGDVGVGLAAGALDLPGIATGVADIGAALGPGAISRAVDQLRGAEQPSAVSQFLDRPFSRAASAIGEATGIQPGAAAQRLREDRISPQLQAQQQAVDEAFTSAGQAFEEGDRLGAVGQVAEAYLRNPRTIAQLVTESLPATLAGGLIGRGVAAAAGTRTAAAPITGALTPAAAPAASGTAVATGEAARQAVRRGLMQQRRLGPAAAGAIGQAPIVAGATMQDIDDEVAPQRAALASLGVGVGSALIAGAGASAARRAGLVDIDTAIAGGGLRANIGAGQARRGVVSRVSGGAAAEGVLQELPQEALQQMGTNWAEGEPLLRGVPRAAIEGLLAGGVMGAAVNIRGPRQATTETDLIRSPSNADLDADTAGGPPDLGGADLRVMLRYHRQMNRIAQEATEHPDLQEQAMERIEGVLAELGRRGMPREVVDLELSKARYQDAQLELEQMQRQYRRTVGTDPQRARGYLQKARQRAQEIQSLEQAHGSEALQSPDLATVQTLQEMEGAERYFRQRDGQTTNRLKRSAVTRLREFRDMDDETLARQLNNDRENAEEGREPDRWAQLRVAAAEERGMTSAFVEQVAEADAGGTLRAEREAREGPTPTVTEAEDIRTEEDLVAATEQFDDEGVVPEQPPSDPRTEAMQLLTAELPTRQRQVWDTMQAVIQEGTEGLSARNVVQRIADRLETTRQNVDNTFKRMQRNIARRGGVEEPQIQTTTQFINSMLGERALGEDTTPGSAAQETVDRMETEQVMAQQEPGSPAAEILGAGSAGIVRSPGASQAAIGAEPAGDAAAVRAARVFEAEQAPSPEQVVTEQEAEAAAFEAEAQAAAEARREQLRVEAEELLSTPQATDAGRAWDKRAQRIWTAGTPAISWEQLVQSQPEVAANWVASVLDMMAANPQGMWLEQLRSLFTEFARDISNEQRTTQAEGRPEPAQPGAVAEPGVPPATLEGVAEQAPAEADAISDEAAGQPRRVTRRGRRQPIRAEELQPPQAATADAIEDATLAASEPQVGPEALERVDEETGDGRIRLARPVHLTDGSRLSGFTDNSRSVLYGFDRNGDEFTVRLRQVDADSIASSQDNNRSANALRHRLAMERMNVLLQESRAAAINAHGGLDANEQALSVSRVLDVVNNPESNVEQVLDATAEVATDNPGLMRLIDALRGHVSLQNIRFLAQPLVDASNALGHYYSDVHSLYINSDIYQDRAFQLVEGERDPARRVDLDLAETIVHELIHAASIQALQAAPDSPEVNALTMAVQDLDAYINENPDRFSERELEVIDDATINLQEMITYSLTNQTFQRILARVPSSAAPQRQHGFLSRIVQTILDMVGIGEHSNTVLESMTSASLSIIGEDASVVRQRREDLAQLPQDTWNLKLKRAGEDIRTMAELGWDTDPYVEAIEDFATQADAATMNGDDAARVVALEGMQRIINSTRLRVVETQRSMGLRPRTIGAFERVDEAAGNLAGRMYDSAVGRAPRPVQNWLTSMKNTIRRLPQAAMFSHDFVDYVKGYLPQVEAYFNSVFHRLSERNNQHVAIQKIVDPVTRFTTRQREQMNTFLRDSTYSEMWGFQPDWINQQVQIDPKLARQFEQLPPEAQKIAQDMFRYAFASNQSVQAQLRADIVVTYDGLIEKAKRNKQRTKLETEKAAALAEHDARQIDRTVPYLPLKRWGEWAVVHKSTKFRQAEATGSRREINELKADPDHYQVVFAESEFQARQERDRMADELGVTIDDPFPRMRYEQANESIPLDLINRLRTESLGDADRANMSAAEQRISSAIDKMYIEALAESSVRKSELRRLKVEGAGRDMVRAFVEHGQGLAALSSAMKLNKETRRVVADMKQHARDPSNARNRPRRMEALNEVLARHAIALEVDSRDSWQQKAMGYTSIWMLLTSPAYYIQNSTQPFMLTYPVLAARFGATKSMGYMRRAYSDVFAAQRSSQGQELLDPMKLTDPEEQALFGRLQRLNLLDVGIAADLGTLRESRGPIGRTFHQAHRRMLTAVRTVEVYNRGVTAISSYRLQKQKLETDREAGRNQMSDSAIVEQSKQYALKTIQTTQGDYSGPNAPRLISMLPAGRLLTQFRKFQLIQIGLLTRTFHQAFKGATPTERTIGRRQMMYILGMHGMIGGAMGLPAANIIGYALVKAFGDEDEPADAELLARRAIGNKEVADLVLRGLPARLGIDASNRLGMGLTFSVMPFADISASRDGMYTVLGNLLGPAAGLAAQMADGVGQIQEGNVALGTAQLLPSLLRNSIRAYMFETDGVRMRNGDLALSTEELSWFDTATQGMGWPSKRITDRYFAIGALRGVQEHFKGRTTKIKQAYVAGFETGDQAAMSTARDEWRALQRMRREYGVGDPQPLSNLIRAARDRRERERLMVEGVPTQRTTRRFVESLFE